MTLSSFGLPREGMTTQTDQAACQAVNIDSAVVLLVCNMAE